MLKSVFRLEVEFLILFKFLVEMFMLLLIFEVWMLLLVVRVFGLKFIILELLGELVIGGGVVICFCIGCNYVGEGWLVELGIWGELMGML